MIISRTPLRISFAGGGSDLASFYKYHAGAVVSTAINKYIYITVNKKFDDLIRASYSITEFAKSPKKLKHELIREALLFLKIYKGIEITSISDIPSKGTGLGSSSTYIVGLLNALYAFKGEYASSEKLAREACHIEIGKCGEPIGKQDQYVAAFGNFNYIKFNPDESVSVNPIICKKETKCKLAENLLMFYTGLTRSSSSILEEQNRETVLNSSKRDILSQMVDLAGEMKKSLEKNNLDKFGNLLHEDWKLKKQMARGISNRRIDKWYKLARNKGVIGGKILGAGGGGFLLLYAPKYRHRRICSALSNLRLMPFAFEPEGSRIIYYGER